MNADEVLVSRGRAARLELAYRARQFALNNQRIRSAGRGLSAAQVALVRLEAELQADVAAADDATRGLAVLHRGWAA